MSCVGTVFYLLILKSLISNFSKDRTCCENRNISTLAIFKTLAPIFWYVWLSLSQVFTDYLHLGVLHHVCCCPKTNKACYWQIGQAWAHWQCLNVGGHRCLLITHHIISTLISRLKEKQVDPDSHIFNRSYEKTRWIFIFDVDCRIP